MEIGNVLVRSQAMECMKKSFKTIGFTVMLILLLGSTLNALPVSLQSDISLSNIIVTNLESLNITNRVIDPLSTSASAVASDIIVDAQTQANKTSLGSVSDVSESGKVFSSSTLLYDQQPGSIFSGTSYTLSSNVTMQDYGFAQALATVSEMVYFTALTSCEITFSLDYTGADDGINPGPDLNNYSNASISYQIANFNDALSQGFAGNVADANSVSPGTLSTTMHFDQGDSGWITLSASAGTALYAPSPAPVPEPATLLLLGAGLVGLAGLSRKLKR